MAYIFEKYTSGGGSGGGSGASNDGLKVAKFSTLNDITKFLAQNSVCPFKITYKGVMTASGEGLTEPVEEVKPICDIVTVDMGGQALATSYVITLLNKGLEINTAYIYETDAVMSLEATYHDGNDSYSGLTLDTTGVSEFVLYYADEPTT